MLKKGVVYYGSVKRYHCEWLLLPRSWGGGNFKSLIDLILPVGINIILGSATDPNDLYPGTTWERIKGKMIAGLDEDDEAFDIINYTAGEKTHKLTLSEMPSHSHMAPVKHSDGARTIETPNTNLVQDAKNARFRSQTNYTGGGQAHNNMPPYIVKYIWERIA